MPRRSRVFVVRPRSPCLMTSHRNFFVGSLDSGPFFLPPPRPQTTPLTSPAPPPSSSSTNSLHLSHSNLNLLFFSRLLTMPFVLDDHIRRGHPITFGLLVLFSFIELVQTAVLVGSCQSHSSRSFDPCRADLPLGLPFSDNRHNDYPSDSIRDRYVSPPIIS